MNPPVWIPQDYVRFRPTYPTELYEALVGLAPGRGLAWDCATGNGQAAVDLSPFFARVVATDRDAAQIAHAMTRENIEYRVASAEASGLADASVDLITVACGVHWFAASGFFAEAARVLRPGGVLAVWTYDGRPRVCPAVDHVVHEISGVALADDFPAGFEHVRGRYRDLPMTLPELDPPRVEATADWTVDEFLGHLGTWSGARAHRRRTGVDAITAAAPEIRAAWPGGRQRVTWSLHFRIGRRPAG